MLPTGAERNGVLREKGGGGAGIGAAAGYAGYAARRPPRE